MKEKWELSENVDMEAGGNPYLVTPEELKGTLFEASENGEPNMDTAASVGAIPGDGGVVGGNTPQPLSLEGMLDRMVNNSIASEEEKKQLRDLLFEYKGCFADQLQLAGAALVIPQTIELKVKEPIFTSQYQQSKVEDEVIVAETLKNEASGVVRPSWSPYNSPVMVV